MSRPFLKFCIFIYAFSKFSRALKKVQGLHDVLMKLQPGAMDAIDIKSLNFSGKTKPWFIH